jgi:cobalt-zinc-cadmium efflux system protein
MSKAKWKTEVSYSDQEACEDTDHDHSTHLEHSHAHSHDEHFHSHHHHHFSPDDLNNIGFKLKVSTAFTILFVIAGVIAGVFANSLALISDAAHNFTDALALILALFAVWLQKRPASATKTYGYHRAGILAAFINSSTLLLIAAGIFYEAVERLFNPEPIETGIMLWIAIAGLIVNAGIGFALHRESKSDITIRSAYIHMLGDAAGTVGIIIGSLLIKKTGLMIIDPLISIGIGVLVLWTSWDILKETVNLLLEGTPRGINVEAVSKAIQAFSGVRAVHHVHIWGIATQMTALSCHIQVDDVNLSHCNQLMLNVNKMLKDRFQIDHATIQFETDCSEDKFSACQNGPRQQSKAVCGGH